MGIYIGIGNFIGSSKRTSGSKGSHEDFYNIISERGEVLITENNGYILRDLGNIITEDSLVILTEDDKIILFE